MTSLSSEIVVSDNISPREKLDEAVRIVFVLLVWIQNQYWLNTWKRTLLDNENNDEGQVRDLLRECLPRNCEYKELNNMINEDTFEQILIGLPELGKWILDSYITVR